MSRFNDGQAECFLWGGDRVIEVTIGEGSTVNW